MSQVSFTEEDTKRNSITAPARLTNLRPAEAAMAQGKQNDSTSLPLGPISRREGDTKRKSDCGLQGGLSSSQSTARSTAHGPAATRT